LREILATGDAHCEIRDEQTPQVIDTQRLQVELGKSDNGQAYPRVIHATGDVRTSNGKDTMRAGEMTARLAPATQPAARLAATTDPATQSTTRRASSPALKTMPGITLAGHLSFMLKNVKICQWAVKKTGMGSQWAVKNHVLEGLFTGR
jgi:hypothetical protein